MFCVLLSVTPLTLTLSPAFTLLPPRMVLCPMVTTGYSHVAMVRSNLTVICSVER